MSRCKQRDEVHGVISFTGPNSVGERDKFTQSSASVLSDVVTPT